VGDESTLVVIAYPDDSVAQGAIAALERLNIEELIDLEDAAYADKDASGTLRFHAIRSAAAAGSAHGGVREMLAWLPFVGPSPGASSDALAERYAEHGVDTVFVAELSGTLQADGMAVFLLVRHSARDRVIAEMSKFRGIVVKTSLQPEQEQELKRGLAGEDLKLSDEV
jgi:uncharacterized membrane protein